MRRLSQIVALVLLTAMRVSAQSPHGENLTIDCSRCHSPAGWTNATLIWVEARSGALQHKGRERGKEQLVDANAGSMVFRHDSTDFRLEGTHVNVDCRSCHASLVFDEAPMDCAACHTDVHGMSVGNDCARCHTSVDWIVSTIPELHEQNGFALVGAHGNLSCTDCHTAGNPLQFDRVGNECSSCHQSDYMTARSPDHAANGFSTDCIECHDPMGTGWHTTNVAHDFFPLTMGHAIDDCARCHITGNYPDASPECSTCHQQHFTSTTNPDHQAAGFSTDCASCHTTMPGWSPATYDHAVWPLVGGHMPVSCDQCHNGNYVNTPNTCEGCHMSDYNSSVDPNHVTAAFPTDCAQCHNEGSWDNATFDHDLTDFALTGMHVGVNCIECHAAGYTGTPTNCDACHMPDYTGTVEPNHPQASFSTDCTQCHTADGWTPSSYDHTSATGFALNGSHANVNCNQCHSAGYVNTPNTCEGCHLPDYNATTDPNHVTAGFPTDCAQCHNEGAWDNATFDHNLTDFALTGMHVGVNCIECHAAGYTGTPTNCDACHMADYTGTVEPNHPQASFSTDCTQCHTADGWTPSSFDHTSATGFALNGSHANVNCNQCHAAGYINTPNTCEGCHLPDYNATTDPNHITAGFPTDCALCHDEGNWNTATFDHNTTAFPLTGQHTTVDCMQCHANGFAGTPTNCDACHMTDYNGTVEPNHIGASFSTDCTQCHTADGWTPSSYDHTSATGFALSGSHANVNCNQCHSAGYVNTPNTCEGCHLPDYNATTDPNHVTAGFPTDCAQCHNEGSWDNATFDHDQTDFTLTGMHVGVNCLECHAAGYTNTPTNCDACHMADYTGTVEPNHTQASFSTDCTQCHTADGWTPSSYDHTSATGFALNGSHANVNCNQCHASAYTNTPNTCEGCHLPDYNATTDPNHMTAGFPTDCALCHDEGSWGTATFDHNTTAFPLTGQHATVDCMQCHANGFASTPTNCDACHMTDYNGTVEPNHIGASFSTDCTQCHTADGWTPSSYDHTSATGFALSGSHANVNCNQCHAAGYANTPNTCEGCHLPDYTGTTDPNHVTAGFPTDCALCHDEGSWGTATFDHNTTAFPLTGQHTTVDCMQCHANGYAGTPANCDACHLMDYTGTVEPNHTLAGFSTDCTQCHTADGWIPSSFDHTSATGFTLNGSHADVNCNLCHAAGYSNTPNTCEACHMTDYANASDPNHAAAGFPTDCALCHDEGSWGNATFDHNTTAFPLTGQHVTVGCMQCHTNGFAGTPTNCDACHMMDYTATTSPNHVQSGFPADCEQCHGSAAWIPATFDHDNTGFPLTGQHVNTSCSQCHANGYAVLLPIVTLVICRTTTAPPTRAMQGRFIPRIAPCVTAPRLGTLQHSTMTPSISGSIAEPTTGSGTPVRNAMSHPVISARSVASIATSTMTRIR